MTEFAPVWIAEVPATDEALLQGDLLRVGPFASPAGWSLKHDGRWITASKQWEALVIEQCCTHEQKHVLTLARVYESPTLLPDDPALLGSQNVNSETRPYSNHVHWLAPPPRRDVPSKDRHLMATLVERMTLVFQTEADMLPYRERRYARMTTVARAHLRGGVGGGSLPWCRGVVRVCVVFVAWLLGLRCRLGCSIWLDGTCGMRCVSGCGLCGRLRGLRRWLAACSVVLVSGRGSGRVRVLLCGYGASLWGGCCGGCYLTTWRWALGEGCPVVLAGADLRD